MAKTPKTPYEIVSSLNYFKLKKIFKIPFIRFIFLKMLQIYGFFIKNIIEYKWNRENNFQKMEKNYQYVKDSGVNIKSKMYKHHTSPISFLEYKNYDPLYKFKDNFDFKLFKTNVAIGLLNKLYKEDKPEYGFINKNINFFNMPFFERIVNNKRKIKYRIVYEECNINFTFKYKIKQEKGSINLLIKNVPISTIGYHEDKEQIINPSIVHMLYTPFCVKRIKTYSLLTYITENTDGVMFYLGADKVKYLLQNVSKKEIDNYIKNTYLVKKYSNLVKKYSNQESISQKCHTELYK